MTTATPSPINAGPWVTPFAPGDPAPWFHAPTPENPNFHLSTACGRYLLLGFLPPPGPERDAAIRIFQAHRSLFDDHNLTTFIVLRDAETISKARNQPPGLRWFLDADDRVSRLYGAVDAEGGANPYWLLLDPMLRTILAAPASESARMFAALASRPPLNQHAGVELVAPVLVIPRVFETDLCRRLIDTYEAQGGEASGVMRDVNGRTVGVMDNFKRRRDVFLKDDAVQREIQARLNRRLLPEIKRVFQFEATRLERYLVACYDAAEGGYFKPHRDNETLATLHRKFAVSINLNAEEFAGGDLRFPEFGPQTYRPPTGGAVVFACGLQHEATPVSQGRRYAFLPFLYDEAGQAIRDANHAALEVSNPSGSGA